MKVKSLFAFTVLALLALGLFTAMSTPAFAQSAPSPAATPANSQPQAQPQPHQGIDQSGAEAEKSEGQEAKMSSEDKDQGGPQVQSPSYAGSTTVDQAATEGMSETDEATALQSKAVISAKDAEGAALASNPGAKVVKTALDNENGVLVYSVELDNGKEVKVDAGNGKVLHVAQADQQEQGQQGQDNDQVQQEQEGEH